MSTKLTERADLRMTYEMFCWLESLAFEHDVKPGQMVRAMLLTIMDEDQRDAQEQVA